MADVDPWDPGSPRNRERTRESQRQVRALLRRWDPIGVGDAEEAADEYDCMISPAMHKLYDGAPVEALVEWIAEERDHFGLDPDPADDHAVAESLIAWWRMRVTEG
jgi:hypothetical protein